MIMYNMNVMIHDNDNDNDMYECCSVDNTRI